MLTLKRVLYALSAVAIVLAGGSFLLPAQVVVSRSISIDAPPESVFAIVGDLRRFHEFSPLAELDPNIRYAFEGTESGVGQRMVWTSDNPEFGSGIRTIMDYDPPRRVVFKVVSDTRDRSVSAFELAPTTTGTEAMWTFTTDLDRIPARWSGLLYDRRIGAEYEKGLARLKAVAEAER